jgi:hypothetical protein
MQIRPATIELSAGKIVALRDVAEFDLSLRRSEGIGLDDSGALLLDERVVATHGSRARIAGLVSSLGSAWFSLDAAT